MKKSFNITVLRNYIFAVKLGGDGNQNCLTEDEIAKLKTNISQGRLPEDVVPIHYNIELQPYIYEGEPPFIFRGEVQIYMDVLSPVREIYLNQRFIENYTLVNITVSEDSPINPENPSWRAFGWDDSFELFVLYLNEFLVVGARYKLTIGYQSILQRPQVMLGLYWDSYVNSSNITEYVVATQFQSSFARYMMPCFDEPAFKATYNVTLVRQQQTMSLSNMPLLYGEDRGDDWIADVFEQSVKMSAYLLCMVIGNFDYVETVTNKGVSVRIYARPDAIYAAGFANSIAAPMLEWFEDYTGIDYPFTKLDHIALPTKNGAMENWGLSTYGEGFLLYDASMSSSSSRQLVAEVVAHETAHMWFGNLVTCVYWNHTWLNEGFANYFQFQPLLDVLNWSGFEMQVVERMIPIMGDDSVNTSTPVRIEAENVRDGYDSFNLYTYSKGGAILRMISQMIGNETMQKGLQRYLNRFAYGNTDTDDLWTALNEQIIEDGVTEPDGTPIDIKEKVDPWIDQRGHPVMTVDRTTSGVLGISQEMFFNPDGQTPDTPSPWDYLWNIPVTFASQNNPQTNITTKAWNDRQGRIEITEDIPGDDEWILLNPSYTGFYRVLYSQDDQILLVDQLINGFQDIHVNSRSQLIADAFQLARGNYQREVRAMEFTRYLGQETSYNPWQALDTYLGYQSLMLNKFNDTRESFPNYMLSIVDPVYNLLGWESDGDHFTDRLRQIIIMFACTFNNEDCIQQSQTLYSEYQGDVSNNPIEPNQRGTVYCTAIRTGPSSEWDFAYNLYQTIADEIVTNRNATYERERLIPAMACTSSEEQMQTYLDATYDPSLIRTRDARSAVSSISRSDIGRVLLWEKLSDNWRDDPLPLGVSKNSVFNEIVSSFNTDEELLLLEGFISTYPPEDDSEAIMYNSALETVRRNMEWVDINKDELHGWFERYTPTSHKRENVTDIGNYSIYSLFFQDRKMLQSK